MWQNVVVAKGSRTGVDLISRLADLGSSLCLPEVNPQLLIVGLSILQLLLQLQLCLWATAYANKPSLSQAWSLQAMVQLQTAVLKSSK